MEAQPSDVIVGDEPRHRGTEPDPEFAIPSSWRCEWRLELIPSAASSDAGVAAFIKAATAERVRNGSSTPTSATGVEDRSESCYSLLLPLPKQQEAVNTCTIRIACAGARGGEVRMQLQLPLATAAAVASTKSVECPSSSLIPPAPSVESPSASTAFEDGKEDDAPENVDPSVYQERFLGRRKGSVIRFMNEAVSGCHCVLRWRLLRGGREQLKKLLDLFGNLFLLLQQPEMQAHVESSRSYCIDIVMDWNSDANFTAETPCKSDGEISKKYDISVIEKHLTMQIDAMNLLPEAAHLQQQQLHEDQQQHQILKPDQQRRGLSIVQVLIRDESTNGLWLGTRKLQRSKPLEWNSGDEVFFSKAPSGIEPPIVALRWRVVLRLTAAADSSTDAALISMGNQEAKIGSKLISAVLPMAPAGAAGTVGSTVGEKEGQSQNVEATPTTKTNHGIPSTPGNAGISTIRETHTPPSPSQSGSVAGVAGCVPTGTFTSTAGASSGSVQKNLYHVNRNEHSVSQGHSLRQQTNQNHNDIVDQEKEEAQYDQNREQVQRQHAQVRNADLNEMKDRLQEEPSLVQQSVPEGGCQNHPPNKPDIKEGNTRAGEQEKATTAVPDVAAEITHKVTAGEALPLESHSVGDHPLEARRGSERSRCSTSSSFGSLADMSEFRFPAEAAEFFKASTSPYDTKSGAIQNGKANIGKNLVENENICTDREAVNAEKCFMVPISHGGEKINDDPTRLAAGTGKCVNPLQRSSSRFGAAMRRLTSEKRALEDEVQQLLLENEDLRNRYDQVVAVAVAADEIRSELKQQKMINSNLQDESNTHILNIERLQTQKDLLLHNVVDSGEKIKSLLPLLHECETRSQRLQQIQQEQRRQLQDQMKQLQQQEDELMEQQKTQRYLQQQLREVLEQCGNDTECAMNRNTDHNYRMKSCDSPGKDINTVISGDRNGKKGSQIGNSNSDNDPTNKNSHNTDDHTSNKSDSTCLESASSGNVGMRDTACKRRASQVSWNTIHINSHTTGPEVGSGVAVATEKSTSMSTTDRRRTPDAMHSSVSEPLSPLNVESKTKGISHFHHDKKIKGQQSPASDIASIKTPLCVTAAATEMSTSSGLNLTPVPSNEPQTTSDGGAAAADLAAAAEAAGSDEHFVENGSVVDSPSNSSIWDF